MTTINISLPEPLKFYIDQQIDQGHYQTIDEYFCELIRQDQERQNLDHEEIRIQMQKDFKNAGIETDEQILELIRDVKKELLQERFELIFGKI